MIKKNKKERGRKFNALANLSTILLKKSLPQD